MVSTYQEISSFFPTKQNTLDISSIIHIIAVNFLLRMLFDPRIVNSTTSQKPVSSIMICILATSLYPTRQLPYTSSHFIYEVNAFGQDLYLSQPSISYLTVVLYKNILHLCKVAFTQDLYLGAISTGQALHRISLYSQHPHRINILVLSASYHSQCMYLRTFFFLVSSSVSKLYIILDCTSM